MSNPSLFLLLILAATIFFTWLTYTIGMLLVGIVDDVGWKETSFRKLILFLVRLVTGIIIFAGALSLLGESGFFR